MKEQEKLDELCEKYRQSKKELGSLPLAELEDELWRQLRKIEGPGLTKKKEIGERRDWLHRNFGGVISDYERRSTIYRAGEWAYSVFDKVDNKALSYTTASLIISRTKEISRDQGTSHEVALKAVLDSFDGTATSIDKASVRSKKKDTEEHETSFDANSHPTALSKKFKAAVKTLTEKYVEAMFGSRRTSDFHKRKLADDLRISVDQIIDEFMKSLYVTKQKVSQDAVRQLSKEHFDWACEVLGLSEEFGKPIDIKRIKRVQIRRARDLHPDRNPTPEAREEYEAVNNAFDVLRNYAEQLPKRRANGKEES